MKKYIIGLVSVVLLGAGIVSAEVTPTIFLTRVAGIIRTYPYTAPLTVGGVFTQGGGVIATSTTSQGQRATLSKLTFATKNVVDLNIAVQNTILDLPATSTLASTFLPSAGMTRTLFIRNSTTTAGITLSISTTSTGYNLRQQSTTTPTVYSNGTGKGYARLELIRRADTDIDALLTVFNN